MARFLKSPHAVFVQSAVLAFGATALVATATASQTPAPTLATAQQKLAAMSVPFVPNAGQWDARAAFAAQTFAGTVFVTKQGELVYSLPGKPQHDATASRRLQKSSERSPGWALTETLVDTSGQARSMTQSTLKAPAGYRPMESKVSYATAQQTGTLNTYERVNLGDMYPGINVQLRAAQTKAGNNVEKIFTVAPQHDPKQIRIKLAGAENLEINANGELIAHTGNGPVAFTAPIAFQENDYGERVAVDVAYQLVGADLAALSGMPPSDAKSSPTDRATTYSFTLGTYDPARPLIIDPLLASTYLGGGNYDEVKSMAVHPHTGQVYVAGQTDSPSFPQSGSGAQSSATGTSCFVSRYSADLQQLLQSTYLGNGTVLCLAIAIHPGSGVVYVAGSATGTSTFPSNSTTGAIQPTHTRPGNSGSKDGFVALFSADLSTLTKATFFGGSTTTFGFDDQINAIAVHPHTGLVHIAGWTPNSSLPGIAVGTQIAFSGGTDAFIARLPADLMNATNVRYTFIGGNNDDLGRAVAIDPRSGDVFVAGDTNGGLPSAMLFGAAQGTYAGTTDAFVARLKEDLSAVVRATYLGGAASDQARSIALHPLSGEVVVAGRTSSNNLPQSLGGAQPVFGDGSYDGFVSRLSADLTAILQTTYLGGMGRDCERACQIAIHPQSGEVFVAGDTTGGLPIELVADGYQSSYGIGGAYDTFIVRLNAALTARRAGTYLGGDGDEYPSAIAIEPNGGSVYVAGYNNYGGFPTVNAQQGTFGGNGDGFVSRLSTDLTAVNRTPNPFNFIHQSNVPPNAIRTSNEVRLIIEPNPGNNQQSAYVTGAPGSELCVANQPGICVTPFVACAPPCYATDWFVGPWDFVSGDYIAVRHTSAASGTAETKLIISGTAYPFRTSTGNANIACNLDMNASNTLTPPVEGLILVRAMLGFTGNAVVNGTSVTPTTWDQLRPTINTHCGTNFR